MRVETVLCREICLGNKLDKSSRLMRVETYCFAIDSEIAFSSDSSSRLMRIETNRDTA